MQRTVALLHKQFAERLGWHEAPVDAACCETLDLVKLIKQKEVSISLMPEFVIADWAIFL